MKVDLLIDTSDITGIVKSEFLESKFEIPAPESINWIYPWEPKIGTVFSSDVVFFKDSLFKEISSKHGLLLNAFNSSFDEYKVFKIEYFSNSFLLEIKPIHNKNNFDRFLRAINKN